MAKADMSASANEMSTSAGRSSGMLAKPLRTKRKSASAERCLRPLGATIDMATPDHRDIKSFQGAGYFCIDVYEKAIRMSRGLLGFVTLRELLIKLMLCGQRLGVGHLGCFEPIWHP